MIKFVECWNLTENALHIAKHSMNPDVGKSRPVEIAFVYENGLGIIDVMSDCLSVCLSVYLSVCQSVCLSVCLVII
jgi:hypothetical protein